MITWNILGIVAIICLFISFFSGKSALWGGLTIGIVAGLIAWVVTIFHQDAFNWLLFKKIVIILVLLGFLFVIIGRMAGRYTVAARMTRESRKPKNVSGKK